MFGAGRLCVKTAGREAGKHCVIVKKIDEKFVMVTGPREVTNVRRRKCNIHHLEPLMIKIDIKPDASDEEIIKVYEKEKIYEKLGIEKPKPKPKKEEKPKETKPEKKKQEPAKKAKEKAKPEKESTEKKEAKKQVSEKPEQPAEAKDKKQEKKQ